MSDSLYFEEEEDISLISKIFNYVFLIGVLSILVIGPRLLIDLINTNQINKGIYEGVLRGLIVIAYIYLVGRTKDAQELFEYHGAEHMTIASYEDKKSLQMDDIKTYPKEHIRCGTAFIFLIVFVSLLTLPFIPTLNIALTFITRILHIFVVAMISYEILKFNFKNSDSFFAKIFSTPGI
jgi:Predicted metal-dependent enzyme